MSGWNKLLSTTGIGHTLRPALGLLPEGAVQPGDTWSQSQEAESPAGQFRLSSTFMYDGPVARAAPAADRIRVVAEIDRTAGVKSSRGTFGEPSPPTSPPGTRGGPGKKTGPGESGAEQPALARPTPIHGEFCSIRPQDVCCKANCTSTSVPSQRAEQDDYRRGHDHAAIASPAGIAVSADCASTRGPGFQPVDRQDRQDACPTFPVGGQSGVGRGFPFRRVCVRLRDGGAARTARLGAGLSCRSAAQFTAGSYQLFCNRSGSMATAFLPMPQDIRTAVEEEVSQAGGRVLECLSGGDALFVRTVLPHDCGVRPQDRIQGGVALLAAGPEIRVQPFTYRKVCSNGAVMAWVIDSHAVAQSTLVRRRTRSTVLEEVRKLVRACTAPEVFSEIQQRLETTAQTEANLGHAITAHAGPLATALCTRNDLGDHG